VNPPVGMVPNIWVSASNKDIPVKYKQATCKTENIIYTPQRSLAVSLILGFNLSGSGPGTSDLNNCIPPAPKAGRIATTKTIIPIPPSHWIKSRQKRIE